jgi:hypothetical protein
MPKRYINVKLPVELADEVDKIGEETFGIQKPGRVCGGSGQG